MHLTASQFCSRKNFSNIGKSNKGSTSDGSDKTYSNATVTVVAPKEKVVNGIRRSKREILNTEADIQQVLHCDFFSIPLKPILLIPVYIAPHKAIESSLNKSEVTLSLILFCDILCLFCFIL
jgi:hypothetical protein